MQIAAHSFPRWIRLLQCRVLRAAVGAALISLMAMPQAGLAAVVATGTRQIEYVVEPGDTLLEICAKVRPLTRHYALDDLLGDIRRANGLDSHLLGIGQRLVIPVATQDPGRKVGRPVTKGAQVQGIYLSGPACGVSSVLTRVDDFIAAGGNAVVFDAKDIDGGLSYQSDLPLAGWGEGRRGPLIPSLPDLLDRFHQRGLYVVARLAVFLDGQLGTKRPDLALQGPDGGSWRERGCVWLDPADPDVRGYTIALALELARAGVDEVQFDYVRYPTNGWRQDWAGSAAATGQRRREVINGFLAAARDSLRLVGVKLSADLYGVMAWDNLQDLALTGQHVPSIAKLVDTICPMIYPSHFGPGFAGHARPADVPGQMVQAAMRGFVTLVEGQATIRPWLQAFPFGASRYDQQYIQEQLAAAGLNGAAGWCFWNPACHYALVNAALPAHDAALVAAGPSALALAGRGVGAMLPLSPP